MLFSHQSLQAGDRENFRKKLKYEIWAQENAMSTLNYVLGKVSLLP